MAGAAGAAGLVERAAMPSCWAGPTDTWAAAMTWRDRIQLHSAALLFPPLSSDQLRELSDDIKQHGVRSPVTLLKPTEGSPQLLDGRNRLDAAERAGLSVVDADGNLLIKHEVIEEAAGFDPVAFVV